MPIFEELLGMFAASGARPAAAGGTSQAAASFIDPGFGIGMGGPGNVVDPAAVSGIQEGGPFGPGGPASLLGPLTQSLGGLSGPSSQPRPPTPQRFPPPPTNVGGRVGFQSDPRELLQLLSVLAGPGAVPQQGPSLGALISGRV